MKNIQVFLKIQAFLKTRFGSVVNVALYIIASSAITGLIDWISAMDLSESSILTATVYAIVNLILVGIKQAFFKK